MWGRVGVLSPARLQPAVSPGAKRCENTPIHSDLSRFVLRRDRQGVRTHHAHFVAHRGPLWAEYLLFRDRLRASPELRGRYEALKRDLADKFHDQRERYTASKTDFVKEVLGLGDDEEPRSRG